MIFLHGLPTATQLSGIIPFTILPAPIITLFPMSVPPRITELLPIKTLFPIFTFPAEPKIDP